MNTPRNRQWRVARYPAHDEPISTRLFDWSDEKVPEPRDNEFVVKTVCLTPGPAQRGYLRKSQEGAFLQSVEVGDVMRGRGVGRIVKSRHRDYPEGAVFVGSLGWQDYSLQTPRGKEFIFSTRLVEKPAAPLSGELSLLGQAGVTAYFGLHEAAQLQAGDNVLVSAAAGGVGSAAGQIARIEGAGSVVGIAGGADKCRWLVNDLGYTAAIDYQAEDLDARLGQLFPSGIDVFFDNVGGDILNAGLAQLADHARVAICGFISTDYDAGADKGPINYRNLVSKRARMQGFVFFDYWDRYDEAATRLQAWHERGLLHNAEHVTEGLENMPDALAALFSGGNKGVSICRVSDDDL